MPRVYFLTIAVLTSLVDTAFARNTSSNQSTSTAEERSGTVQWPPQAVLCGPNALYMLLKAHDQSVSADVFFREVAPGDQGLSLAELRNACSRYGLPAEVRHCTYEQLVCACPLPLVALLHRPCETAGRSAGHYVLVVDASPVGVTLIDGTRGEQERYSREVFCRNWKGYVVVPVSGQQDWLMLTITIAAWLLIGSFIFGPNRSTPL